MCLGELAQVVDVGPGSTATVRGPQRTATVSLMTLDRPVAPGDWLLCHSGFALALVSTQEAAEATGIRTTPAHDATTLHRKDHP